MLAFISVDQYYLGLSFVEHSMERMLTHFKLTFNHSLLADIYITHKDHLTYGMCLADHLCNCNGFLFCLSE